MVGARGVSLSTIKLKKRTSWAAAALIQVRGEVDGDVSLATVGVEQGLKMDDDLIFATGGECNNVLAPGPVGSHRCLTTEDHHPYTKNSTLPPAT
jgi:hypothetical protein